MVSATARRNVSLLTVSQALANTSMSLTITTVPLVGAMLAEDKALATVPHTFQWIAIMAMATPASYLMHSIGRRNGFMLGAAMGVTGSLTGALAIWAHSFWLFCLATAQLGVFSCFAMFYRFAAAEAAEEPQFRAKAISYVIGGGIVAAFIGPEIAKFSKDLMLPYVFAGTYVCVAVVPLFIIAVIARLDMPRAGFGERTAVVRPIAEIARQPGFVVAVFAAMIAWGGMVFLMTSTPLAMVACGFDFRSTAFVIQWHIVAMYAPSFVTGWLIGRFGLVNVMTLGAAFELIAAGIGLSGIRESDFLLANVFVGSGWSFLFVGATELLTRSYRPSERAKVQGFNDMMIFGMVALSTLVSGYVTQTAGWGVVVWIVIPFMLAALAAVTWLRFRPEPAVAGP
jgi:MFS family permease